MQTMGLKKNLNSPFYVQYKNKTLVIVYQNTTLLPTGDFYYSQTSSRGSEVASGKEADRNGAMLFWIYVSVSGLLFILIVAMTIAAIVSKDREEEKERERGEKERGVYYLNGERGILLEWREGKCGRECQRRKEKVVII